MNAPNTHRKGAQCSTLLLPLQISQAKELLLSHHSLAWDAKIILGKQHLQLLLRKQKTKINELPLSGLAARFLSESSGTNFIFQMFVELMS